MDIVLDRLGSHGLIERRFVYPSETVSWLGAVQAQDFAASKWSLGMRTKDATDKTIEQSFNEGKILRTHVMRPTWHFVTPEDIRPLLELTAPRIKSLLANYERRLGISEELLSKSRRTIADALAGGNYLPREELSSRLEKVAIKIGGQILGNIIMHFELDGLICSGPRKGKQFTYALLEDRVPNFKNKDREEVRAKLVLQYFTSHGPAQLKDFVWWSGLSVKDATDGLESAKSKLAKRDQDGKTFWFSPRGNVVQRSPNAYLLSMFDEYVIAYKDRDALGWKEYFQRTFGKGTVVSGVVILNGKIVGHWKRVIGKDHVSISASLFRKVTAAEKVLLESAAGRYSSFLGLRPKLELEIDGEKS